LDIRKHFLSERAVRHRVPREVLEWSLEMFWKHVDVALSDMVGEHGGMGGWLDYMVLVVFSDQCLLISLCTGTVSEGDCQQLETNSLGTPVIPYLEPVRFSSVC